MAYEDNVIFRPPSEARSVILQCTIGCSHNKCTFCKMYINRQFRVRNIEEIKGDIDRLRMFYGNASRVFLADGNALALSTDKLIDILDYINKSFNNCTRISSYGSAKDILRKSEAELIALRKKGLKLVYMGIESGNDEVLRFIRKGVTSDEVLEACSKLKVAGIKLSVTIISGIGGKRYTKKHGVETAELLNKINPEYIGLLALRLKTGTELYEQHVKGEFELLSPNEVVEETYEIVRNLELEDTIFRSNHAGNYFSLAGTYPQDKARMIAKLESIRDEGLDIDEEYENIRRRM